MRWLYQPSIEHNVMRGAHALLSVEIYTRVTTTRQCESKMYKGGGEVGTRSYS